MPTLPSPGQQGRGQPLARAQVGQQKTVYVLLYLQSWARVISFRHGCPSSGINTDAVDPFPVLGREEVLCRADEKIQMGDNYHT